MEVSARMVQRALGRLFEFGLVERLKDHGADVGGPVSTAFRLASLVYELELLAHEYIAYRPHGAPLAFKGMRDGKAGSTA